MTSLDMNASAIYGDNDIYYFCKILRAKNEPTKSVFYLDDQLYCE